MTPMLRIALIALLAWPATAVAATEPEETPLFMEAGELTLDEFLWLKRPVIVFADTPADPRFQMQMNALRDRPDDLRLRDVVVITDTDPRASSPIRRALRPRGFMLVIVGKDGQVKMRKPQPWDVREISRSIDKFPLRQDEILERRAAPAR
ncbi:hypothetical protein ATO6_09010 [Oceanicola sp. 22II-s10i]|uniref:DUF4174 domain-containing protein n=1 Tax=Oceanicola sp. 22II-s10i TaxID=1317116 RepID=UPI000B523E5F|nr:DUF4174 domain-containing protein [Oceanicola sp. 22II-s10i]OWU85168.1 hypothetical protein ATO6_09010 [Oceanicola sp. 22II-s10i]